VGGEIVDRKLLFSILLLATSLMIVARSMAQTEPVSPLAGSGEIGEIEPNDTPAQAQPIAYGDVVLGNHEPGTDIDWFRFQGLAGDMVAITAQEANQQRIKEPILTLNDSQGNILVVDTENDRYISWINYLLPVDGTYTISFSQGESIDPPMPLAYRLTLNRSHTLYVSAAVDGLGGNANIKAGDIVARHPATGAWTLVFDASDVGITQNINAFEWTSAGRLLISLQAAQNVSGLGRVTPYDIIRFTPSSLGENTAGTFSFYLKGADVGLSATGEKIDAIAWEEPYPVSGSRLLISTNGSGAVPRTGGGTLQFQKEDVIALDQSGSGQPVQGTWSLYMDGTSILGLSASNLNAFTTSPRRTLKEEEVGLNPANHFASASGSWTIAGLKGNARDVLRFSGTSPDGFDNWDSVRIQVPKLTDKAIDGLSLGPPWSPAIIPTVTATSSGTPTATPTTTPTATATLPGTPTATATTAAPTATPTATATSTPPGSPTPTIGVVTPTASTTPTMSPTATLIPPPGDERVFVPVIVR
jgi:hypothetical protein